MVQFFATVNLKNGAFKRINLVWEETYLFAFSSRRAESVKKHMEELKKSGIEVPQSAPMIYQIDPYLVRSCERIYVIGNSTSAEVELFFACDERGREYITVGSDHTDREMERESIARSKQLCSKPVAPVFWSVDEIEDHLDELIIECRAMIDGAFVSYQKGKVGEIMELQKLKTLAKQRSRSGKFSFFSGTLPLLNGELIFSNRYELALFDPVLQRSIRFGYMVEVV